MIFVTGRNKVIIEDHFDKQFELETTLLNRGKLEELVRLSDCLQAALPSILANYLKNSNDSSALAPIQSSNLKDNLAFKSAGT